LRGTAPLRHPACIRYRRHLSFFEAAMRLPAGEQRPIPLAEKFFIASQADWLPSSKQPGVTVARTTSQKRLFHSQDALFGRAPFDALV